MEKRTVDAKEILADIKSGMDDAALKEKYRLSEQRLESVFNKLIAAGVIKQAELDNRTPFHERTMNVVWKCPACGKPQTREFEECPECGVIAEKFKNSLRSNSLVEEQPARDLSLWNDRTSKYVTSLAVALLIGLIGLGLYWMRENTIEKMRQQKAAVERAKIEAKIKQDREEQMLEKLSRLEKMEREKRAHEEYRQKMKDIGDGEKRRLKQIESQFDAQRQLDDLHFQQEKASIIRENSEAQAKPFRRTMSPDR